MEGKILHDSEVIEIDTIWTKLPKSFYDLNPMTFRNGNTFYCLLGQDHEQCVFGAGSTPEEAVREWDCHLQELLFNKKDNSEFLRMLRSALGINGGTAMARA